MKIATKKFMSIQKGINGRYNFYLPGFFIVLLFFIIADLGCQKDAALSDAPPDATGYQEIDLVADTTCNSAIIDENLKNAWELQSGLQVHFGLLQIKQGFQLFMIEMARNCWLLLRFRSMVCLMEARLQALLLIPQPIL